MVWTARRRQFAGTTVLTTALTALLWASPARAFDWVTTPTPTTPAQPPPPAQPPGPPIVDIPVPPVPTPPVETPPTPPVEPPPGTGTPPPTEPPVNPPPTQPPPIVPPGPPVSDAPEPATLGLMIVGAGIAYARRKRKI